MTAPNNVSEQLSTVAAILAEKGTLPKRELFFAALHEALKQNARKPWKQQSLALSYFQTLLEAPAYHARYIQNPSRKLSKAEAKAQGEALVEKFILSRMPGFLPEGHELPALSAQDEELFADASELLRRRTARELPVIGYKPVTPLTDANGKPASSTMERLPDNRRGVMGRRAMGLATLGLMSLTLVRIGATEMRSWPYPAAMEEQRRRTFLLQKKVAMGMKPTMEDLKRLDIERVADDVIDRTPTPFHNKELLGAQLKMYVGGAAVVAVAGRLMWQLFNDKGTPAEQAVHHYATMMLSIGRQLDQQTRAVYDAIPDGPSLLPAGSEKTL